MRGYRKFTAYMVTLLAASILNATGTVDSGTFGTIATVGLGLFAGGNVGEHMAGRK